MKTLWISALCLCLGGVAFSQATVMNDLTGFYDQFAFEKSKGNALNMYGHIQGTPFLNEVFIPGNVVMNDSVRYSNVSLRYNIYTDKMEFLKEKTQVLELDIHQHSWRFEMGNAAFVNLPFQLENGIQQNGLLWELCGGNIRLYKKLSVELLPATATQGFQDAQPDRFVRKDDRYFLALPGVTPVVYRSSKELIESLRTVCPNVDALVKQHKLKLSKEQDVIRLVQFCNSEMPVN
ncbi:hypothetical protein LX69_01559 [Breznakibacter xylanolyticus]|uniref:GLPGLI family protein n=1 Tax=Breznakibacter xylanolyticus TaxID=990 RepID=A0A2W7NKQ8_9BACT|nr:hypothetical protein [Breznakibacter xylanolyticus]PZX17244.1 hypothetical protein LX69_01559 [Breznakibacter xylanolyticus]